MRCSGISPITGTTSDITDPKEGRKKAQDPGGIFFVKNFITA